jgi:hypothetical protein
MVDERTGTVYKSQKRNLGLLKAMVGFRGPSDRLWNHVEKAEDKLANKPAQAQTAYSCDLALPRELSPEQAMALLVAIAEFIRRRTGAVVDVVMHLDRDGNPHGHLLWTQRAYDEQTGQWGKKYNWLNPCRGGKGLVELRSEFARLSNEALAKAGFPGVIVEHESYKKRGLLQMPQKHEGEQHRAIEVKTGRKSKRQLKNEKIIQFNNKAAQLEREEKEAEKAANKTNLKALFPDDVPVPQKATHQPPKPLPRVETVTPHSLKRPQGGKVANDIPVADFFAFAPKPKPTLYKSKIWTEAEKRQIFAVFEQLIRAARDKDYSKLDQIAMEALSHEDLDEFARDSYAPALDAFYNYASWKVYGQQQQKAKTKDIPIQVTNVLSMLKRKDFSMLYPELVTSAIEYLKANGSLTTELSEAHQAYLKHVENDLAEKAKSKKLGNERQR